MGNSLCTGFQPDVHRLRFSRDIWSSVCNYMYLPAMYRTLLLQDSMPARGSPHQHVICPFQFHTYHPQKPPIQNTFDCKCIFSSLQQSGAFGSRPQNSERVPDQGHQRNSDRSTEPEAKGNEKTWQQNCAALDLTDSIGTKKMHHLPVSPYDSTVC